jgi:predicted dehydrogenase
MSQDSLHADRRDFIKIAGAATALGAIAAPRVFAAAGAQQKFQLALIGCGGRGTGAVADAINGSKHPIKLVAMADVFQSKVDESYNNLSYVAQEKPDAIDVPEDRRFVGFDAYKQAMDCLNPGDIAIFASPLAFRWVHYQYAIEIGLHVFMEKPVVADAPTGKRMLELAKKADEKNLKAGVGLMVRHCRGRQELHDRIADGEIGDIICMRAYRMHDRVATCFSDPKPADKSELLWQIERFHSFIWASGGLFNDFYIHQIDECCWMKNAWPVKAQALGGRHFRGNFVDQNFDAYAVEYTFEDGSKFFFDGRTMADCYDDMSSIAHGSKGSAIISTSGHTPGKVRTFKGQNTQFETIEEEKAARLWAYPQPEKTPYELEWTDLIEAIVNDTKYNEVPRGVEASMVSNLGRMAAHTGQEMTLEQMWACPHEFAPGVADFTMNSAAPVHANAEGKYPVPLPGVNRDREYGDAWV